MYEIWHTPSGNALSEHPTRRAALDAVRDVLELDGLRSVRDLALLRVDKRGDSTLIAAGDDLIRLAEARVA